MVRFVTIQEAHEMCRQLGSAPPAEDPASQLLEALVVCVSPFKGDTTVQESFAPDAGGVFLFRWSFDSPWFLAHYHLNQHPGGWSGWVRIQDHQFQVSDIDPLRYDLPRWFQEGEVLIPVE